MKVIKIFLASSIEDLALDRLHVGAFFNQLNNIYRKRDIGFELVMCEDYDNSIVIGGKQKEYDREIRESELVFFLFFRKVGDYTKHEFEVAMEAFKDRKKPKIITYFKYVTSIDEAAQEVQAFMQLLDREIGHYYNTYGHVDTLKLGILMQIKLLQLDDTRVELKNGEVSLNGQPVVKAENVPLLNGNQTLRELTEEYRRLQAELDRCYSAYLADHTPENKDAVYEASAKLNRVSEKLTEVEQETMALLTNVAEVTSDGRVLTHAMKEALKYFNQGDYTAVMEILGKDRENRLRRLRQRAAWVKNELQGYVEESLLLIKAIKAQGLTKDWVEEILKIYRDAAELAEEFHLDGTIRYEYAYFLTEQNRFTEAISVAERLSEYYSNPSIKVKEEKKADLYNLLGGLYIKADRYEEAEDALVKAVEIYNHLVTQNLEVYQPGLANCHIYLGAFYTKICRHEKAENAFIKAMEAYAQLAVKNPKVYEPELASCYNDIGACYFTARRYREAENAFNKAFEIYNCLAEQNPEVYEPRLVHCYNNLGSLYCDELCHIKALEILTRLAEQNPDAYESELAKSFHNLGAVYTNTQRYGEAEESFEKAMKIYTLLADRIPAVYEPELAGCYNNLGALYQKTQRYEKAEEVYSKSMDIYIRLADKNPEVYELKLAGCYHCLGDLYSDIRRYAKAEEAYGKAVEIYTRLTAQNLEVYGPNLANCYNNRGILYEVIQRYGEAEEAYGKAVEIYTRLTDQDPELYEHELVRCSNNLNDLRRMIRTKNHENDMRLLRHFVAKNQAASEADRAKHFFTQGMLYTHPQYYGKAVEAYGKALEIYNRLAEKNPVAYEPKLALCYNNLGGLYRETQCYEKAEEAYGKAIDIYTRLVEKNPEVYEPYLVKCRNALSNSPGKIQRAEKAVDEFNFF